MRRVILLPLTVTALATAGCGTSPARPEQTAFQVPTRDLTLQQAGAPAVEVASPVELKQARVERPAAHQPRPARRSTPAQRPAAAAPEERAAAPAPTRSAAPVAVTMASESEAPDPHALAPGQTVTVLPVSTGGTPEPDAPMPSDDGPADRRGGTSVQGGWGGGSGMGGPGRTCGGWGGGSGMGGPGPIIGFR